jgi:hypothetical protein
MFVQIKALGPKFASSKGVINFPYMYTVKKKLKIFFSKTKRAKV